MIDYIVLLLLTTLVMLSSLWLSHEHANQREKMRTHKV